MKSVPLGRRVSAVAALLAPLAVLALLVVVLLRRPLVLTAAAGCFSLGVGAAAYAVTRTAWRRTLAAVLAVLALAASVALVVGAVGSVLVVRATAGSW
jgi:energy-coupling factor transporter transmembrane protein EcfT